MPSSLAPTFLLDHCACSETGWVKYPVLTVALSTGGGAPPQKIGASHPGAQASAGIARRNKTHGTIRVDGAFGTRRKVLIVTLRYFERIPKS